MFSVNNIIDKLIEKNEKIKNDLVYLQENVDWTKINSSNNLMVEFSQVSNDLIYLKTHIDDLKDRILENTINPNQYELRKIRELKISKFIEKTFLPFVLYLRLCIDNNIINVD